MSKIKPTIISNVKTEDSFMTELQSLSPESYALKIRNVIYKDIAPDVRSDPLGLYPSN